MINYKHVIYKYYSKITAKLNKYIKNPHLIPNYIRIRASKDIWYLPDSYVQMLSQMIVNNHKQQLQDLDIKDINIYRTYRCFRRNYLLCVFLRA